MAQLIVRNHLQHPSNSQLVTLPFFVAAHSRARQRCPPRCLVSWFCRCAAPENLQEPATGQALADAPRLATQLQSLGGATLLTDEAHGQREAADATLRAAKDDV